MSNEGFLPSYCKVNSSTAGQKHVKHCEIPLPAATEGTHTAHLGTVVPLDLKTDVVTTLKGTP